MTTIRLSERIDKLFKDRPNIEPLLAALVKAEASKPDDQWDQHHLNGYKAGIIESISKLIDKELNYHLTSIEIKEIVCK